MQIASGRFPAERPPNIDASISMLWDFLETCWNISPTERPSATDVVHFLSENSEAIEDAIESYVDHLLVLVKI